MRRWACLILVLTMLDRARFASAQAAPAGVEPEAFDAAPFGWVERDAEGTCHGLRWEEPRKVRQVVITFADAATTSRVDGLRIEYWQRNWKGRPDPVSAEIGAGVAGWDAVDDWTNGTWKRAETRVEAGAAGCTFTFAPTGPGEFPGLEGTGVSYRKTLKIRVAADKPLPAIQKFQVLTDAVSRPLTVRISLGQPADPTIQPAQAEPIKLEIHNGAILGLRGVGGEAHIGPDHTWTTTHQSGTVEADLAMAVDPVDSRYDRTIVTARSSTRAFSFAADEVARGDRILVNDLGALVTRGSDTIDLEAFRQLRKEFPGRTIYDRVWREPEQTLGGAWQDMPIKQQITFTHGLPGDRNLMAQAPNGEIDVTAIGHWFKLQPSPRDTARKTWTGLLKLDFGFPENGRGGRALHEGYLPLVRSWWQDGPIHYEQQTILDTLSGKLNDIKLDDPTLLLMRIRVVNTSDAQTGTARLRLTSRVDKPETLTFKGRRIVAEAGSGQTHLRYLIDTREKGKMAQDGQAVVWTLELAPGASHNLFVVVPSITLDKDAEIDAVSARSFDADVERICAFWRGLSARSTQITTPEPWINDFYKAHARHMLVNCYKELDSDRLHAHVGSFRYGMYLNESAMMVSDLDRRGYHQEAQQNLDSLLHYQGTVAFPGNYQSKEGMIYGDGGHEMGGYNKSHGYALWLIAHHWRMTRDREWMQRQADSLVKACAWIVRERQATMKTSADGSRPIEYGWLPSGSLEDVQDFWFWLATNAATDWGFQAIAAALADAGHPQGPALLKQAADYHQDFMAAMNEARIRAPVVRLRDGTYVPKFPSQLYTRGRAHGWIRETLEGSIFLPAYQLLDPTSSQARWIMQDYEDNLYISSAYGYQIPVFDEFWFSRGGFCMQACLLDSPLPYLYRDEIKHYLRTYFNSFTSGFFPEVRMLNEHALPELGQYRGDHFKTSDEAQSTYWLRLMFIREQGDTLYLGQAIPRYWLNDGAHPAIERAASEFGPMSLRYASSANSGQIKATLTPPTRNPPKTIYLRFRHPSGKKLASVTLNGKAHAGFDAEKEWVILPGDLTGEQEVVAGY